MAALINILNKNSFYYKICLIAIAICSLFLCFFARVNGFIMLNSFHTYSLNYFFNAVTFLGDGTFSFALIMGILVFFKKYRNLAFLLLLAYLLSGFFSQVLKNIITAPRPSVYFSEHHYKFYLDTFASSGVGYSSFPSGHTATTFALATIFSTYLKKKYICICSIFLSFLVGYSRVYLAHHFLIDVFAGALIGILFGTFTILWFEPILLKLNKRIKRSYKPKLNWGNSFPNSSTTNG
jgi:membrane-associated phospholipid phosphatase